MAADLDDRGPDVRTHSVRSWYSSSRPLWLDLVGDYAGKELFLVEGDSLLRECFEDSRLDFDGKLTSSNLTLLLRSRCDRPRIGFR